MSRKISALRQPIDEEQATEASPLPSRRQTTRITPKEFTAKWKLASNLKERSASQSHFNDICALIGEKTPIEADPDGTWYTFEKGACRVGSSKGWADVWKKGCFAWEYKGKHKDLTAALSQLQRYAIALDNPPLLVVSDMETIIIHTNFNNSIHEEHRITLDDLDNHATLLKLRKLFTAPNEFRPDRTTETVTKQAAGAFAKIAQHLRDQGFDGHRVAHFITKLVFCMFAEDISILPDNVFSRTLESVGNHPAKFAGKLKDLFGKMKSGGNYGYVDIPWFNGGLFDDDDSLPLDHKEVKLCIQAARLDWSQIEPSIFGTLFERGLDPSKRSQIGAHYTDPESIQRIINPVIKEPLEAEWSATKREIEELLSPKEGAKQKKQIKAAEAKYEQFLQRLCSFKVLDAACGSGNFLYLALVELKNLEHRVSLDGETYGFHRNFHQIGPQNVIGIEINDYAAELARVTIWIGEIQWMIRNGFGVPSNPVLKRLDHIEDRDALLNKDGTEAEWPEADCIIGNPPFLGDKRMLSELGEKYVQQLRRVYAGRVPGGADLVTYWFEKARATIAAGTAKRAGLVATNSIRQKRNRAVLESIRGNGRIFNAWGDLPWVNDGADVRVSLVCFDGGGNDPTVQLDGKPVVEIYSDLKGRLEGCTGVDVTTARSLAQNVGSSFFGLCLAGAFDVPGELARQWLRLPSNPNGRPNSDVLRPLCNGADLLKGCKDRWVIDFGATMSEQEAALYEAPFQYVLEQVKPLRIENNRKSRAERWWLHGETRPGMRRALAGLKRYIATVETAKHRIFVWLPATVAPEHKLVVIPSSDDTIFGILSSRIHITWALAQGGRLGVGNDPVYSSGRCFETFPFPSGMTPNIPAEQYARNHRTQRIAAAAKELVQLRDNWLNPPEWVIRVPEVIPGYQDRIVPINDHAAQELKKRTLTNLYNLQPQWLVHAHRKLDEAVSAAYGWDATVSDEEVLRRLLELNQKRSVAAVIRPKKTQQDKSGQRKPYQRSFIFGYTGGKEKADVDSATKAPAPKKKPQKASNQIAEDLRTVMGRAREL